ncbi:unnamed protein product [Paramecium pentaurelia]|uniref:Uncharacterized protein n=1 Tax=Paramecium pentaurelia TaxID=43138 RepID=A0A8S1SXT4_9CILI|nr:unnamed protein product [Paramecium pentaurelia]
MIQPSKKELKQIYSIQFKDQKQKQGYLKQLKIIDFKCRKKVQFSKNQNVQIKWILMFLLIVKNIFRKQIMELKYNENTIIFSTQERHI